MKTRVGSLCVVDVSWSVNFYKEPRFMPTHETLKPGQSCIYLGEERNSERLMMHVLKHDGLSGWVIACHMKVIK